MYDITVDHLQRMHSPSDYKPHFIFAGKKSSKANLYLFLYSEKASGKICDD